MNIKKKMLKYQKEYQTILITLTKIIIKYKRKIANKIFLKNAKRISNKSDFDIS